MTDSVPDGWSTVEFDSFTTLQRGKDLTKAQFREGTIPVAGSNGVIGYHDTAIAKAPGITVGRSGSAGKVTVYEEDFWPHNTSLYVRDFHGNDPHFAGFLLDSLNLARFKTGASVPTLDRNSFKTLPLLVPPLPEQKKIAHILSTVQRAIEAQERIIQTTTELKKALMHKLFTEGLRHEPQKQTEIGLVPESWDVLELGKHCRVQSGFAFRSADYVKGDRGIPITKIGDIQDGGVFYTEKSSYVPEQFWADRRLAPFKLEFGDVLIALTGATTGKSGVFQHQQRAFLNQRAGRFLPDDIGLKRCFLPFLVTQPYFQKEISSNILVAAQGNISPKRIEKIKIGLPGADVQEEVAASLDASDRKVTCSQARRTALQELFRTLLHELMTAKSRVTVVDIRS